MRIEIKKFTLVSIIGAVFLSTGYFLFETFFRALIAGGLFELASLISFFVSLIYLINYFLNYNLKAKMAKEAAREVVELELKTTPETFRHISPETRKSEIESHLIKKINEEKYILWGNSSK